jgi:Fe-S oxidoreductase
MPPVALHDPCFLGRYNSVFDAPRDLIRGSGGALREPSLSGRQSYCCGAGGGRMWIEEQEPRVNTARFDEIYSSCRQPSTIAVACPFCRTMLSDASKSRGKDEEVQVKDVVELVAESLES